MQNSVLSVQEMAVIARALEVHAVKSGNRRILGAQLGFIINEAVRPRHLRELGGVRKIAVTALADLLHPVPVSAQDPDIAFEIKPRQSQTAIVPRIPDSATEVAGADLWRLFSNPKIACSLTVTPAGEVCFIPPHDMPQSESAALTRPSAEDYRRLAVSFAQLENDPLKTELMAVAKLPDFYNSWIVALRRLRTQERNLLKSWEILRSDFIADSLRTQLQQAGLDVVRASEIVATARPIVPQRSAMVALDANAKREPAYSAAAESPASKNNVDELSVLRRVLHEAIDRMSLADLRELRIPAGAMIDVLTR